MSDADRAIKIYVDEMVEVLIHTELYLMETEKQCKRWPKLSSNVAFSTD
jgi:hypothetical protein